MVIAVLVVVVLVVSFESFSSTDIIINKESISRDTDDGIDCIVLYCIVCMNVYVCTVCNGMVAKVLRSSSFIVGYWILIGDLDHLGTMSVQVS